ncbi:DMT family transporter [Candidatus Gottesmanbacteria bacterium]|nr:DMT family transporter [Candidatus Gottesmanbacteria bacterium]
MNTKIRALLALFATTFLWALMVVIVRSVIADVRPMCLLFLRLLIAAVAFLPFFIIGKPWKRKQFSQLLKVSVFSTINLTFFMLGIQYTSASASQLIYAAMPILILVLSTIFFKEKFPQRRILGVLIGFMGMVFIIYLSAVEKGTTISGSLLGNLLIIVAMVSWMLYILFSKKISVFFSPVDIGSVSIIVSFILSVPLFIGEVYWIKLPFPIPVKGIWAAAYMGIFGTFLTYLLYQYGLKYTTPLTASFTSYIQPVITVLLEVILLGSQLTLGFVFGGALIILGVFAATTLEFYHKRVNL